MATSIPEISELRATAEEAARRGGAILAERFDRHRTIEFKGGAPLDQSCGDVLASCQGMSQALLAEIGRFLQELRWTPQKK